MFLPFSALRPPRLARRLIRLRAATVAPGMGLLLLALGGCDEKWLAVRQNDRALRQAMSQQAAGDYPAAAASYEAALDGTARTAETHFRLALMLHDKLNDPLGTAYHLRLYLKLAPDGSHAKEARATLESTETNLATNFGGGTLLSRSEALKIKAEEVELRRRIAELETQLNTRLLAATSNTATSSTASAAVRVAEAKARLSGKTYVVQPGDTLERIAKKTLRNKFRVKDLEDANFTQLGNPPKKLKPGMTLLLP